MEQRKYNAIGHAWLYMFDETEDRQTSLVMSRFWLAVNMYWTNHMGLVINSADHQHYVHET